MLIIWPRCCGATGPVAAACSVGCYAVWPVAPAYCSGMRMYCTAGRAAASIYDDVDRLGEESYVWTIHHLSLAAVLVARLRRQAFAGSIVNGRALSINSHTITCSLGWLSIHRAIYQSSSSRAGPPGRAGEITNTNLLL